MGVIKDKKEENQRMLILVNTCKKYLWDLSYPIRIETSNYIALLNKKISENRVFINDYLKKEEGKQMSIYDYKD